MGSFPAVFCAALKNGEDALLAVEKNVDHEWTIKKVTEPSISARQFIAPTIIGKTFD